MKRAVQVLDAVSILAVVGAAALLVWPARSSVTPTLITSALASQTVATGTKSLTVQGAADSTATQIVAGNLFSASRRAPATAFVPPGMDGSTVGMNSDGGATASTGSADDASAMAPSGEDGPQLFGIVTQDGQRRALLQMPGADAIPRLMAVGDRRAGYRVVSIAAHTVVIVSSTGSRTLRLAPRTSPDSLENLP